MSKKRTFSTKWLKCRNFQPFAEKGFVFFNTFLLMHPTSLKLSVSYTGSRPVGNPYCWALLNFTELRKTIGTKQNTNLNCVYIQINYLHFGAISCCYLFLTDLCSFSHYALPDIVAWLDLCQLHQLYNLSTIGWYRLSFEEHKIWYFEERLGSKQHWTPLTFIVWIKIHWDILSKYKKIQSGNSKWHKLVFDL